MNSQITKKSAWIWIFKKNIGTMGIILQKIYMVENGTSHVDMFYTTLGIIAGDAQGICIISGITLPIFSKKILIWEFMIQTIIREFILKGFPGFGCQNSNL